MEGVRGWGSQYYDEGYQARLLHVDDVGVGAVGGADKHFYLGDDRGTKRWKDPESI
jgi:hypothetical protein